MGRGRLGLVLGGLMMPVFWGGLIALIVFLVPGSTLSSDGGDKRPARDARDILAERFARGEISEEEFESGGESSSAIRRSARDGMAGKRRRPFHASP